MNKLSINIKLPYAIQSEPVINPKNGYKYVKRITQEFKDFQQYCKDKSLFFNGKEDEGEKKVGDFLYKNIWINVNPEFVDQGTINGLMTFIYKTFMKQTTTKFDFEN